MRNEWRNELGETLRVAQKHLVVMVTAMLSNASRVTYRATRFLSLCVVSCSRPLGEHHGGNGVGDNVAALSWLLVLVRCKFYHIDSSLHLHWFLSCERPSQIWQPQKICQGGVNERKAPKHGVRPEAINHCSGFLLRLLAQCFKLVLLS